MIVVKRARRAGFTLIELLVVIAIIGVLVAMTAAGVMQFLRKGDEVANRSDVQQLSSAVSQFEAKYGVKVPSLMYLAPTLASYNANPTAPDYGFRQYSLQFLKKIWPNVFSGGAPIYWSGNTALPGPYILTGDQCLVFFLGGIQTTSGGNGVTGFSTNHRNPAQIGGSRTKILFRFKASRLVRRGNSPFFSYQDVYGQPFAYFNTSDVRAAQSPVLNNQYPLPSVDTDCQPLIQPFYKNVNADRQYYGSFQIISAGANKQFGRGGLWDSTVAGTNVAGEDDIANFHPNFLGVGE